MGNQNARKKKPAHDSTMPPPRALPDEGHVTRVLEGLNHLTIEMNANGGASVLSFVPVRIAHVDEGCGYGDLGQLVRDSTSPLLIIPITSKLGWGHSREEEVRESAA
jgi:hypothetical protein